MFKATGNALQSSSIQIQGVASLKSVSPNSGSVNGGTELTIVGNGFDVLDTHVNIGTATCEVSSVSSSSLTCTTYDNLAVTYQVAIVSGGQSYPTLSYTYSTAKTPVISSISPSTGSINTQLSISGSGFGTTLSKNSSSFSSCSLFY